MTNESIEQHIREEHAEEVVAKIKEDYLDDLLTVVNKYTESGGSEEVALIDNMDDLLDTVASLLAEDHDHDIHVPDEEEGDEEKFERKTGGKN